MACLRARMLVSRSEKEEEEEANDEREADGTPLVCSLGEKSRLYFTCQREGVVRVRPARSSFLPEEHRAGSRVFVIPVFVSSLRALFVPFFSRNLNCFRKERRRTTPRRLSSRRRV